MCSGNTGIISVQFYNILISVCIGEFKPVIGMWVNITCPGSSIIQCWCYWIWTVCHLQVLWGETLNFPCSMGIYILNNKNNLVYMIFLMLSHNFYFSLVSFVVFNLPLCLVEDIPLKHLQHKNGFSAIQVFFGGVGWLKYLLP